MGISRYYAAINTPPNKFNEIRNIYSPERGSLRTIDGHEDITPAIPNMEQIFDVTYLDQALGDQQWLTHYAVPTSLTFDSPPTSGWTFTTPTGGGATFSRTVFVQYVYQCGTTRISSLGSQTFKTVGSETYVDLTIPTSTPATNLYSMNFYMNDEYPTTRIWMGTIMRKQGSFPATSHAEKTIRLYMSATSVSATANNSSVGDVPPTGFSFTPTTVSNGNLQSNRIYYFSICPWIQQLPSFVNRLNKCALFIGGATGGGRFAAYLPPGYNALDITFTGGPTSTGPTTPTPFNYSIVLAGKTPEEMAPIGDNLFYQGLPKFGNSTVTSRILDMPYNTNMVMSMATTTTSNGFFAGTAIASRLYGQLYYMQRNSYPIMSDDRTNRIGLCSHQFPYSSTSHKEMLPFVQMTFTADQDFSTLTSWKASYTGATSAYNDKGFVYGWNMGSSTSVRSVPYSDKQIFVNGYSNPYLCNGDLALPLAGDDLKRLIPITKNIGIFKDRLILGCGPVNFSYDRGIVFYSTAATITDFGSGAGNFLNMNFGDSSELVGFGSFSQDLSNVGPTTFLGIGKTNSTYVWNGGTTASDQQLVQVGKALGWLSPDSYALTKEGPVVATPQGLYRLNGSDMKEVDPGTEFIFSDVGPTTSQSYQTKLVYTEDRVVVMAPPSSGEKKEYWYDFRNEPDGSVSIVPTGPHTLPVNAPSPYASAELAGQFNATRYGSSRNYRVAWTASPVDSRFGTLEDSKVYRMESPGRGLTKDTGAVLEAGFKLNSTGLGADEFVKRLTRFYFDMAIPPFPVDQVDFNMVLLCQDGASIGNNLDASGTINSYMSVTGTMEGTYNFIAGGDYQYRKYQYNCIGFGDLSDPTNTLVKPRGTVFDLDITFTPTASGASFNIRSFSLLYNIERRRRV